MKPVIYQLLPRLFTNDCPHCVHDGSIEENGVGKFNEITKDVLDKIHELGVTHIWYTGVLEHATKTDYSRYGIDTDNPHVVKGRAGSPYAIKDYYDVDPDLAQVVGRRMDEWEALIERTHDAGMEVIMDFVPNHTARRYHSDAAPIGVEDFGQGDDTSYFFSPSNDYYYTPRQRFAPYFPLGMGEEEYVEFPAKATGNDCFTAFPNINDWYETVKLNYGVDYGDGSRHFDPVPPVWIKMLSVLRFWAGKGVDAFRCDMVHMVPVEFWRWAIPNVKDRYPRVKFIAEIYDVNLYRSYLYDGGFDYLYDKVNLYDTLRDIETHNHSAATITTCWQRVDGIQGRLLNFLENHDEQRFASPQYACDPARAIPSLVVAATISTGPMMIYMGQELGEPGTDHEGYSGEDGRTTIFDYWSIEKLRRWLNGGHPDGTTLTPGEHWLRNRYRRVLTLCNESKAIERGRFYDVMYVNYDNPTLDPHRQYAYLRSGEGETLVIVANFDRRSKDIALRIPLHAFEMLDIPQGRVEAVEMLTGRHEMKTLQADKPFEIYVPSGDAVVWCVKHDAIKADEEAEGLKDVKPFARPQKNS